jgi:hypothetical protein
VKTEVPERECDVVLDERAALRMEIERIRDGEIIIVFYDKFEPLLEVLKEYGAVPAMAVEIESRQASVAKA